MYYLNWLVGSKLILAKALNSPNYQLVGTEEHCSARVWKLYIFLFEKGSPLPKSRRTDINVKIYIKVNLRTMSRIPEVLNTTVKTSYNNR